MLCYCFDRSLCLHAKKYLPPVYQLLPARASEQGNVIGSVRIYIYSASNLQGPLFQFFTNAFVFFCRMGTVGDVKLKVCKHVDKSFLIVCV